MNLPVGLQNWRTTNHRAKLTDLDSQTIKELQARLDALDYYDGSIDGVAGSLTLRAFAEFKKDRFMADPDILGSASANSLFKENGTISEQGKGLNKKVMVPTILGTPTGVSTKIPGKSNIVFANQFVDGSRFFTWGEILHGTTRIPADSTITKNLIDTVKTLDWVREKWGKPIAITSGYRDPATNQRIGGAKFSQHIYGRAVDFYPIDGDIYELLKVVQSSNFAGIGLGMKHGFIHGDTRSGGRVVFPY